MVKCDTRGVFTPFLFILFMNQVPKKKVGGPRPNSGRPTKLTPEVIQKLEQAFSFGCSAREACIYAGISEIGYYSYLKKYPELKERFDLLKERPILKAREAVVLGFKKDPWLAWEFLKKKRPDEFKDSPGDSMVIYAQWVKRVQNITAQHEDRDGVIDVLPTEPSLLGEGSSDASEFTDNRKPAVVKTSGSTGKRKRQPKNNC